MAVNVNSTTARRINKEANEVVKAKTTELEIIPFINGDIYQWKAVMRPAKTSVYSGAILELGITFPANYPFEPPKIIFLTPIYHPNINTNGCICISTLSKDWSPALTTEKTLYSIMSLLDEPNPADPLRPDAAELYSTDREAYKRKVRELISNCKDMNQM